MPRGARSYNSKPQKGLIMLVGGHEIRVTVSTEGEFYADWEDDTYRSTTWNGLRAALLPKVRDDLKRCSVPAYYRNYGDDWKFVTLIGLHASNGNVLYVDSEGKTHQERGHRGFYKVLTPAEMKEWEALDASVKAAEKKLKTWLKKKAIDAPNVVRKAIGAPLVKRDAPDDDDDD